MIISSEQEMFALGKKIIWHGSTHILLYGELGAGKTHLVKWLAEGMWLDPNKVKSPTFTYVNVYDEKFAHFDLYRLETYDDFVNKGLEDLMHQYDYVAIERPKREEMYVEDRWTKVSLAKVSDNEREVEVG